MRGAGPRQSPLHGQGSRRTLRQPCSYAARVSRPSDSAGPSVIIAVGDEVLSGHTLDTNSNMLAGALFAAGFAARRIEVVGDHPTAIGAALSRALDEAGVEHVVISGGIGPTPDDLTFEAVAAALGRPLQLHPEAFAHIQALVRRMHEAGWIASAEVSPANMRSAMLPAGAELIANRRGMAPAVHLGVNGKHVYVLPGIPREFTTIVEEELIPHHFGQGVALTVLEVRYRAVPEAEMAAPMRQLAAEFPDVTVGSYPQTQRRELVMRLRGHNPARVAAAAERLRQLRTDE